MEEFKKFILEKHKSYSFYYEIIEAYKNEHDEEPSTSAEAYEFYQWYVTQ